MIIAVGYRVNSLKATNFRQWATKILSEYIKKGELNKPINDNLEANSHTLQNKHSQICEYNK